LALEVNQNVDPYLPDAWTRMPIDELDPKEVEEKFKLMQRGVNKSKVAFDQLKLKNPKGIAE
jgi:hypothetical protein